MLSFKKKPNEFLQRAQAMSATVMDGSDVPLVKFFWIDQEGSHHVAFGMGRHLIGSSPFAHVKIPCAANAIVGAVTASAEGCSFRCLTDRPSVFHAGKKMKVGDSLYVGDQIELTIDALPFIISGVVSLTAPISEKPNDAFALSPDELRRKLSRELLEQMNQTHEDALALESEEMRATARLKLRKLTAGLNLPADYPFRKEEIERQVFDEVLGLGPLEPLLEDPAVSEIMVNRRDQIFIERKGQLTLSPVSFSSDQALLHVIERIVSSVGRRIDTSSPIVDARLLDGSRVNAVIPPLALNGPCLTIRRFSKKPIQVSQLVEWGSMTEDMAKFLYVSVCERKNIMISGGTGSGKTTLLNALSSFIPDNERIVTVEDAAELQLQQAHVIRMETRPPNLEGVGAVTIRDLVKNTLRMRPDRIIVGECRGAEALDMLQAMNTGHDGSMTTAHANTPEDVLRRIETMVMMAGMDLPLRAIREQVVSAVKLVVQQTRRKSGRRLVTDISWIRSLDRESGAYEVLPLFQRNKQDAVEVFKKNIGLFFQEEEMQMPESPKETK